MPQIVRTFFTYCYLFKLIFYPLTVEKAKFLIWCFVMNIKGVYSVKT